MPNHCKNRVDFFSDKHTTLVEVHNLFYDRKVLETKLFGHFIPEPDWSKTPLNENTEIEESLQGNPNAKPIGEVGELPVYVKNKRGETELIFKSTGQIDERWYDWRRNNWGTKWDCYELEIDDTEMPDSFRVTFDTAWNPPVNICNAIRQKYSDLSVQWHYDEPLMQISGYL